MFYQVLPSKALDLHSPKVLWGKAQQEACTVKGSIQRLLLDIQRKRPTKVDVFMAIEMTAAAWTAIDSVVMQAFLLCSSRRIQKTHRCRSCKALNVANWFQRWLGAIASAGRRLEVPALYIFCACMQRWLCMKCLRKKQPSATCATRMMTAPGSEGQKRKQSCGKYVVLGALGVIWSFSSTQDDDMAVECFHNCKGPVNRS